MQHQEPPVLLVLMMNSHDELPERRVVIHWLGDFLTYSKGANNFFFFQLNGTYGMSVPLHENRSGSEIVHWTADHPGWFTDNSSQPRPADTS